jgi:hypothetical protein
MRIDLSHYLVHFTKASESGDAYSVLKKILRERRIIGSSKFRRGGQKCVCFTEAPLGSLEHGLINSRDFSRYAPFGIQFSKEQIFALGGRPVIYQPESEFLLLPETLAWRHVRFELRASGIVDFTWEREWRLPCEEMPFRERDVTVVLPDEAYQRRFVEEMERESFYDAWSYSVVLGDVAWAYDSGNPWKIVTLKEC